MATDVQHDDLLNDILASPPTPATHSVEDEVNYLNQFIAERAERIRFKHELKQRNLTCERPDENYMKKLDSSIKKITAFIRRLKNLTESQKDSLSKDITQLNLTKYISEVAAAFTEAKLKMNDINCALFLCSQLHQQYSEFSAQLFELWQKILSLKKDDKVLNPSKLRVDLRLFAELITIGVLPEKDSLSLLGNQLTVMTLHDKDHAYISIISSFCKHCGEDFANLIPIKMAQLAEKHSICVPMNNLYSADRQNAVKKLFKEYYRTTCQYLVNEHREVQMLERQNRKTFQTKGELSTDKKDKAEQAMIAYQKLYTNTEVLAELLGEPMPELPIEDLSRKEDDIVNIDIYTPGGRFDDFDSSTSPWEDEETRQFYECFPDLKALVPSILYKDSEKAVEKPVEPIEQIEETDLETVEKEVEQAAKEECEQTSEKVIGDVAVTTSDDSQPDKQQQQQQDAEDSDEAVKPSTEVTKETIEMEIVEEEQTNTTTKILMDAFIAQLPNCVNRELIDKAAKDFCMNLNTKSNRKRLVNALFQVQRTRLDLLPFYSRLVGILNPCMPEIANDLGSLLKNDFRFHIRKKDQINIESKIKNVRFIGELVKFQMFPKIEALNCLKTLLGDLKHHNIEMTCNLLETCGRYLYRNNETHQRAKLLLEILMRKKQASTMDNRYAIMIENAFYYCNPPENTKQIEKKIRIPLHEYIKKLIYKELNKLNVEKILRQMRKINWNDEDIFGYAIKCLVAAWNVRYNSIHCLANLVSGLASYHEEVGINVVDGVLEDIRLGLEVNLSKFNQRRVSMVKYLGELYNYRMVESAIVFRTLYTIITYGFVLDLNTQNDLDPADNQFRVRLICTLLDTCGQYFDHGTSKKKLDCFLLYFQRYYLFKRELCRLNDIPRLFPLEIEYIFMETINALKPNFKYATTYAQACEQVNEMEKELRDNLTKAMHQQQSCETLDAINENDEDDDYYEEEEEDGYESDSYAQQQHQQYDQQQNGEDDETKRFNSYPRAGYEDDEGENESVSGKSGSNQMASSQLSTSVGASGGGGRIGGNQSSDDNEPVDLSDKEDINVVLQSRSNTQMSKEDEEFIKAFDTVIVENVTQRTKEAFKMPNVDIALPIHLKKQKTQSISIDENMHMSSIDEAQQQQQQNGSNKFNFVFMVKKGNKPQFHNLEVPLTSEFAEQFRAREQAEKVEKEKLKQLTLNINERIEQEELQEMMQGAYVTKQSVSANTNRDRRQKYNHPKGAPDADLIFGSNQPLNEKCIFMTDDRQHIVCYHPEVKHPYEHTRKIERNIEAESVLENTVKNFYTKRFDSKIPKNSREYWLDQQRLSKYFIENPMKFKKPDRKERIKAYRESKIEKKRETM